MSAAVKPKKLSSVRVLPGWNLACMDEKDRMIPSLQVSLLELFAEFAAEKGINVDGVIVGNDPVDRWRIVKMGADWVVEPA